MNSNSLIEIASFTPNSLQAPNAWVGHLPFAAWLIREVSPKIFVELGTHSGNSYFAFCQSVIENSLQTKCYAVDTWQGDEHAGRYNEEIFDKVNMHNKERYAGFSRLLRMTFNDAATYFGDESIDLLHIDGLHTTEAVRHDFETWLPKLAPGAVVIFHDTNVRERNFGVWKLWGELKSSYPNNLEFVHSHGLGVLQLNNAPHEMILEWLQSDSHEKQRLKNYFTSLGSRQLERFEFNELKRHSASLNQSLAERDEQVDSLNQVVLERDEQIDSLNQVVFERDEQISALLNSTSWRMTKGFRWLKHKADKVSESVHSVTIGRSLRYVFHGLPLSPMTKRIIKNTVFKTLGVFFKNRAFYRNWQQPSRLQKDSTSINSDIQHGTKTSPSLLPKTMKILVIDATTPTPDRDSGSLDTWFNLRALVELGFDVTFIPDDLKPLGRYTENIRALGVRILTSNEIRSIKEFLTNRGQEIDIFFLHRIHTARKSLPFIKRYSPNAKIIFNTVDLHYLREGREAELSKNPKSIKTARDTKQAEYKMMRTADVTIVLSQSEFDIVSQEEPEINLSLVPYMREIKGCKNGFNSRKDIIFIGGFLHQPNVDAIKYFVSDIWPTVRSRLPGTNLLVIGSNASEEIIALGASDRRIKVVGFVEDIDSYFNQCRLTIAPLRYGAGIKGKIGTSASYGVPCVATPLAAEGMGLVDGVEVVVADGATQFAEKLIALYTDEDLWAIVSKGSLAFARRNYSYETGKARIETLIQSLFFKKETRRLKVTTIETLAEFIHYQNLQRTEYARRMAHEKSSVGTPRGFAIDGYCTVCQKPTRFHTDFQYSFKIASGERYPNWREHLVCRHCGLNNRLRAAIHLFQQECEPMKDSTIYVTEQTTPLFAWMKSHYSSVVGSEFLGADFHPGVSSPAGIRHESLTMLSFDSHSFDFILSFDVLEHIPDYKAAISECFRVLKRGGRMVFSVPFSFESEDHVIRARISEDGHLEHLMEPEYHGDPINTAGCLCFYHFGWKLLREFKETGFESAKAYFYWSDKFGYLGVDQALFIATKI